MRTLILIGGFILNTAAMAKDGPTYFTPQRIATAKHNIEKYQWAKKEWHQITKGMGFKYYTGLPYGPADTYAENGDEFIWMLMPTTRIARHLEAKYKAQSPGHTVELRAMDPWCGFTIDPIKHPYKVRCKVTGKLYPTNDYHLGDMTSGDYPDDGDGCHKDGTIYYFLREYAHMAYGSAVVPALNSLSRAWAITGDKRYGRAGCILLARLAMEYPNYDDKANRLFYAKYPNTRDPDVDWKIGGMVTDLIWETENLHDTALAYDGLFSYMDQDRQMLSFLKAKGMPIATAADLRRYIEDNILRVGLDALLRGHIHGNPGMHQAAALAVALALDDYDTDNAFNSKTAVDYMVKYKHAVWGHVGHDALIMINGTDRSGGGHESPNYSCSRFNMVQVNQYMDQIRSRFPDLFPLVNYPDLFRMPKIDRIYDFYLKCSVHGYFTPSIGDCDGIYTPNRVDPISWAPLTNSYEINYLYALKKYGDPRYARACTNFRTGELASGDLFESYPEQQIVEAINKPESKIEWKSRLIDGYGLAILDNSNDPEHRRAVSLNYTNLQGHAQCDPLTIQLFARGVSLLPDLGYPTGWEHRFTWDSNSLAHNTVTVDETQPILNPTGGRARLFASKNGVHIISATQEPYPEGRKKLPGTDPKPTNLFQRTVVMVDIDEQRYYVVDHFAVNGGEQHDQSWHGMLVPPELPDLSWVNQPGTLAGPDVKQFTAWTDKWGRRRTDFPSYLTDIKTTELAKPATWTWVSGLEEGDALRMHLLPVGGPMRVYAGHGRTSARPADWKLHYLIARRQVKDGIASQFVTVLDGYQKTPVVKAARILLENPVVVEVEYDGGKDTIEFNIPLEKTSNHTSPIAAGVCVKSSARNVRIGFCSDGPGYAHATIQKVDYAGERIALTWNNAAEADFIPGSPIRIYNKARSAIYHITAAKRDRSVLWLTLDATALFARGRAIDFADGQISIDSHLTFADGTHSRNAFDGTYIGEGKSVESVSGATHTDHKNTIFLRRSVAANVLKRQLNNKTVSVWQYAQGDRLEIARISASP